ncbi:MAG TPA: FHA domain-containing protein [Roseiflexaceae bacterium]|nr:FHA domain-containing protein [Roseiflexaceae bacterium]
MSDRPSIEKELNDTKQTISQLEKDIKQLREWISSNERAVGGMPESLRRITEDGITRARADLALRENEMQRLRGRLADNQRLLSLLIDMDRKARDIATLEQEQEKIIVLLERHRAELRQLQLSYDELTRPVVQAPCELVLPNNQRLPLDGQQVEYVIGWQDARTLVGPAIDLTALGGSSLGVSRQHAVLRCNAGRWTIEDLGSTNGTYLNESPLAQHTPAPLQDKTTIRVGQVKLFFRYVTQTVRL